jgi:hypothetical protein
MISPRLARSLVTLFALSTTAVALADSHDSHGGSIAAARQRAVDSTVTVRGTVTVPTNAFDAGFAVQQDNAGIYVLASGTSARTLGQEVEITGTLVNSSGLLAIDPTTITARGHGDHIEARDHRTGSVGEATEGRLLELEGQMVGDLVDDSPFGFKLDIDDGSGPIQIFLFPGTGISTAGLHDGVTLNVTCFSNQFEAFFECDPRQPSDLKIKRHHGHD